MTFKKAEVTKQGVNRWTRDHFALRPQKRGGLLGTGTPLCIFISVVDPRRGDNHAKFERPRLSRSLIARSF